MRIVSWNVRAKGKPSAWALIQELNADVYLLQEASVPAEFATRYEVIYRAAARKSGAPQPWGSAILVRRDWNARPYEFTSASRPWLGEGLSKWGGCVAAQVTCGARTLLVASVYVPAWTIPCHGLSDLAMQEIRLSSYAGDKIWLTEYLWAYLKDELGDQEAIVGGDLNSSVKFDRAFGGKSKGNLEIQERMNAIGLTDLLRVQNPDLTSTPTFLAPRNRKPYQLDYLYATAALRDATAGCAAGSMDLIANQVSDHLPIIAEIKL